MFFHRFLVLIILTMHVLCGFLCSSCSSSEEGTRGTVRPQGRQQTPRLSSNWASRLMIFVGERHGTLIGLISDYSVKAESSSSNDRWVKSSGCFLMARFNEPDCQRGDSSVWEGGRGGGVNVATDFWGIFWLLVIFNWSDCCVVGPNLWQCWRPWVTLMPLRLDWGGSRDCWMLQAAKLGSGSLDGAGNEIATF